MSRYLGVDTSNYTTSLALYDSATGEVWQKKQLLPVKEGELGLRQSDALFHHTARLPGLLQALRRDVPDFQIEAAGVSVRPRSREDSYMPCFLAGKSAAAFAALSAGVSCYETSHQTGHILAALYGANRLDLLSQPEKEEKSKGFLAFHISGGTTDCLYVQPQKDQTILKAEDFSSSLDLKAGQAVDRVGLMLGLRFPCGPELEKLALQIDSASDASSNLKWRKKIRPVLKGRNCSLSGIENQCRRLLELQTPPERIAWFCLLSIEAAVAEMTCTARKELGEIPVLFAGGVMSNTLIRKNLEQKFPGAVFAPPSFSSDNAAGVAIFASYAAKRENAERKKNTEALEI